MGNLILRIDRHRQSFNRRHIQFIYLLDVSLSILHGDVPCAVETQRQLGSRLRNHL